MDKPEGEGQAFGGDPALRLLLGPLGVRPVQLGVGTFVAGFGMLSLWYGIMHWRGDPAVQLKGLYDYAAAAFGDSLILPPVAYLIATAYQANSRLFAGAAPEEALAFRRFFGRWQWVAASLGLTAVGIASAYVWPPTPTEANWTSPTPGELNAPGWYHAAFMFTQLYLISGFLLRHGLTLVAGRRYRHLVVQNRAEWQRAAERFFWVALLLGCFGGLLVADRLPSDAEWATLVWSVLREPSVASSYLLGLPLWALAEALCRDRKPGAAVKWRWTASALAQIAAPAATAALVVTIRRIVVA